MSDELFTLGNAPSYAAILAVIVKTWWDDREKRRAATEHKLTSVEEKTESSTSSKLDALVDSNRRIEVDLRDIRKDIAAAGGEIAGLRDRVNGISGDYGPRIKELELYRASVEGKQRGRK